MSLPMTRWRELLVLGLVVAGSVRLLADEKSPPFPQTAHELTLRLQKKIDSVGFEANTPLRDALGHLSEKHGITILMDVQAFKDWLQINEPEATPVKLPRMMQVPLRWILDETVKPANAVVIQEGTILWVVPYMRARQRLLQQSVDLDVKGMHLEKALQELAEQTGFSIVLDSFRSAENAKASITAKIHGVGLEDAVRILANMAGLRAVLIGELLYVTTPENAAELEKEQKQRDKLNEDSKPKPPVAAGA